MTNADKFEKFAIDHGMNITKVGKAYSEDDTNYAWWVWQKALQQPADQVVASEKRTINAPYHEASYKVYFAVIRELGICQECVEENPFNSGGTRDTEKGAKLYRAIYEVLK